MQTVVEPGDWERACCGSPYERNSVVELTRLVVPRKDGTSRYVERHHDLDSRHPTTTIRGRVAAIHIRHQDGSTEQLERLPVTSSDMELHLDEFPEPCASAQLFCGKPRLRPPWLGSSQREVTTLPRVKKCTPSMP